MLRTLRHLFSSVQRPRSQFFELWNPGLLCTASAMEKRGSLELEEVQKVLSDVKADDVRVIHVGDQCDWTDHIVIATGRSTWHVKNIAQALLHKSIAHAWMTTSKGDTFHINVRRDSFFGPLPKAVHGRDFVFEVLRITKPERILAYNSLEAKQKQKGADHMILPAVEGHVGGKWVVIDSGTVIVHALDEKAREYYDLESHLSKERTPKGSIQDLEKAFVKVRPINNSKKKPAKVVE